MHALIVSGIILFVITPLSLLAVSLVFAYLERKDRDEALRRFDAAMKQAEYRGENRK